MVAVTDRDRRYARLIPDTFKFMVGPPAERVAVTVNRYWSRRPEPARAKLVRALLLELEPLLEPGVEVSERKRAACEKIVASWLAGL